MKTLIPVLILMLVVTARAAEKPNSIVIYADDMGYGDCTVNNAESKIPTPHIDRLAKEGLRFTDAHSPNSTCTGSRYGLLTGICPVRTGVTNRIVGLGPVIDRDEVTIADFLKDRGYITRMVGKWHLGFELHGDGPRKTFDFSKPLVGGPLDCGFDSFFGVRSAVSSSPYFYIRDRAPVSKPTESTPGTRKDLKISGKDARTAYSPGDIAPGFVPEQCNAKFCDEVVRIIMGHATSGKNKPFFLYYAMLEPHTPWLPTKEHVGKSKAGPYGDYIVQLDHEVGRVLQALRESGLEKDTLVIFSSDNGAMWRREDIERYGHRANGVFSGTKGTAWEGGHRVPFIVKWPGKVRASTVSNAVINHTDLFATLADVFKVDIAKAYPGSAPDSTSFLSVLEDPRKEHHRPGMVITAGSYRLGDWKLRFARGARSSTDRTVSDAVLHNLSKDPAEEKDLSDSHPETKARLFAAYQKFVADRKLKPLAVKVLENMSKKKGQKRTPKKGTPSEQRNAGRNDKRPKAAAGALRLPKDIQLSKEQQARAEALINEYRPRIAELQKKLTDVLTNEQKQARDAARKRALEDGKRGMALRKSVDAAVTLADEQKKQLADLRQAIAKLTREYRGRLRELLTDEQNAKVEWLRKD